MRTWQRSASSSVPMKNRSAETMSSPMPWERYRNSGLALSHFFGGTALSRTHLMGLRLSEDIDLIAVGHRHEVAPVVQEVLTASLRRSFATHLFVPDVAKAKSPAPSVMVVGDVSVQIQLLSRKGYPHWPTEGARIEQ